MSKDRISINDLAADHMWSMEELAAWRVESVNEIAALKSENKELLKFAEVVWEWFGPATNSMLDIYAHPVWQKMKKEKEKI